MREAYEAEYEEEFERFLSARAEEIVDNGLMLLHIPTVPDEVVDSDSLSDQLLLPNRVFDLLGSALMDMAQAVPSLTHSHPTSLFIQLPQNKLHFDLLFFLLLFFKVILSVFMNFHFLFEAIE